MKKVFLTFVIWICLCSPVFANVPVENIYNNHLSEITFSSTSDISELKKSIRNMINDNFEITYLHCYYNNSNDKILCKIYINWKQSVRLLYNGESCSQEDYAVKIKAENILNSITTPNMSDYQKIYRIYHWIQDVTDSDYNAIKEKRYRKQNHYADNMTGVFYYGKAVCTGYSDAFYYLTNLAGIECRFVNSKTHCWNVVKLQGKWYFIDVSAESGNCFLRGTDWALKNNYTAISYLPVKVEKTDYKY